MKNKKSWEEQFDEVVKNNDGIFGHNVEFDDARKLLKKIANLADLEVLDEYTIRITLPPQMSDDRDKILLLLLTSSPMASECRFNRKKDQLTVEWHY